MPNVKLNVPVIVQNVSIDDHIHYHIRPLFLNHPVATHRRYEQAAVLFKKELKRYFRGFQLTRANSHHLLWYMFKPEIKYKTYDLSITVNKQNVQGKFGAAFFELKGQTFGVLPNFYNYMFLLEKPQKGKTNLKIEVEERIKHLLKEYQADDGNEFELERYTADKRTFVAEIEQSVNVGDGKFKFEQEQSQWFFSAMGGTQNFDGGIEIEKVGVDLNSKYPNDLKRAYYREEIVKQVYQIIYQKENTPLVIIGKEGVGKHTILEEVIHRYLGDFYKGKKGRHKRVWHLNPNRVISGMSIVGMWEKRFEAILKFIQKPIPKTTIADVLMIDNPIALNRIGKSASNSLALTNVLKPYLEKRQIPIIILATPNEWKLMQEQERGFADLFQIIRLEEPDLEESIKIALHLRKEYELENDCQINIQAVNQLFTIYRNYLKNQALPGAVLKMMSQLATKYRFKTIDAGEVREEFKFYSGLKERIFDENTPFEKEEVKEVIGAQLVGQNKAVNALVDVVHTIKSKLADKTKPISSLMFIGPTGVGKTQGAKVLCDYLMGSAERLMRFDMNEYIDEGALDRLIGNYQNPEGQLTGKVRYQPFGVLLFDEIEKAHPKIHDLLLQVLDDGRLTNSLGKTVDFTNTIIIMTSNVGANEVGAQLGFATASRDDGAIYRKAVENRFRPEFINRIDKIVIFKPLKIDHILGIARLQIKELLKRDGFVRRTTILNISQEALTWVAKRGYDEKMGGRALKRQIERDLTTLSAEQLISNYSENPIFFDIYFENDRLIPKITPIEFAEPIENEWIPILPDESKGRRFYSRLMNQVDNLERKVERFREDDSSELIVIGNEKGENLDWQYYDFKNKLAELKERLNTISLGFRDRYFKEAPAIPLRLKGGTLIQRRKEWSAKAVRESYKDRLFQEEALKEISENYRFAPAQFDSLKTEFIESYLDVAFLKLFSKGFLSNTIDKITLRFISTVVAMGQEQVKFLIQLYASLFEKLDIQFNLDEEHSTIIAEGHSLKTLFSGEEGIHLFYIAHQNPLPIRLIIEDESKKNKQLKSSKVIRIYDGVNTLTDLRTGFSNDVNITPDEFKLLLFAGLPKTYRQVLRN